MDAAEAYFDAIAKQYLIKQPAVTMGKMMHAPGLTYNSKIFAFYHEGSMTFRLGKDFDPHVRGIRRFSLLSPFKNKGPMKAWFVIPYEEKSHWAPLTEAALAFTKTLK